LISPPINSPWWTLLLPTRHHGGHPKDKIPPNVAQVSFLVLLLWNTNPELQLAAVEFLWEKVFMRGGVLFSSVEVIGSYSVGHLSFLMGETIHLFVRSLNCFSSSSLIVLSSPQLHSLSERKETKRRSFWLVTLRFHRLGMK